MRTKTASRGPEENGEYVSTTGPEWVLLSVELTAANEAGPMSVVRVDDMDPQKWVAILNIIAGEKKPVGVTGESVRGKGIRAAVAQIEEWRFLDEQDD